MGRRVPALLRGRPAVSETASAYPPQMQRLVETPWGHVRALGATYAVVRNDRGELGVMLQNGMVLVPVEPGESDGSP